MESHEAASIDMTAQGGGDAQQRQAAVSFYHAFQSPELRGADGMSSPAWLTAELRCSADFKSASQPGALTAPVESLTIGIDVEVRPPLLHLAAQLDAHNCMPVHHAYGPIVAVNRPNVQFQSHVIAVLQWQAQPLGPAKGRYPTVGAKSMPNILVAQTGGKAGKATRNEVI